MKKRENKLPTFGRRLQWQLMAVFVVTITFLMVLVSLFSYRRSELVIQEQSASLMQQQLQQSEDYITSYTHEVERIIQLLMIQESMQSYMREGPETSFENIKKIWDVFDYANTMLQNYDYIESIYYFGNDGTALGITDRRQMVSQGRDLSLSWYQLEIQEQMEGHMGAVQWFGGYTNHDFSIWKLSEKEEKIPYLTAACPVWLTEDKYVTVVVNVGVDVIDDIFTNEDTAGSSQESYLIDEQGTILIHPNPEKIGMTADYTSEELEAETADYLMYKKIQVNYHLMKSLGWTIVNEIPEEELYGNLVSLKKWFVWLTLGGFLIALALYAYSLYRLTAPLTRLRAAMERMESGHLGEQLDESSRNELGMLGRQFNKMSKSINTMIVQIREMEQEKAMLEKEALQAQLNPHFLFNTLSNMRFMAMLGQTQFLEKCFNALGRMLQPLYRSEGELWSLREELEYVSNYLDIMNIRYNGKLALEFEIADNLRDLQILKFILQPLIENAIEHGFAGAGGEGMIVLGAVCRENRLELYAEDNGNGISEEKQELLRQQLKKAENQKELYKHHVGVVNVHRRIRVHFGNEYGLKLESVPGEHTCIRLTMPVIHLPAKDSERAES